MACGSIKVLLVERLTRFSHPAGMISSVESAIAQFYAAFCLFLNFYNKFDQKIPRNNRTDFVLCVFFSCVNTVNRDNVCP